MTTSRALAFLLIATLLPGCMKVVQHRVANYSPGAPATTQPVPQTAVYSVKLLNPKGKKLCGVEGSDHLLKKGESVGFSTSDTGTVYAFAGGDSFPIDLPVPPGHSIVWSSFNRRPTQFGKEVGKAIITTGKAAAVGTGLMIRGLLTSGDDDD